jgi:hypothetical protein
MHCVDKRKQPAISRLANKPPPNAGLRGSSNMGQGEGAKPTTQPKPTKTLEPKIDKDLQLRRNEPEDEIDL